MKYFKIFVKGFILILIVQIGILAFLDKIYLIDNVSYSAKQIDNKTTKVTSNPKIFLEGNYSNVSSSFDSSYLSFLKDDTLKIVKMENGEEDSVQPDEDMEISNYKWVYDRNRLLLVEKSSGVKKDKFFKLYYYDVENKTKVEVFDNDTNKNIKISMYSKSEEISEIEMSTLTNYIYIKITNANNISRLLRVNIMAEQKNIRTVTGKIGRIISTKQEDNLLYENLNDGKIYRYGDSMPLEIEGNSSLKLLGIDEKDNVYLGVVDNSNVSQIYYGNLNDMAWNKLNINNSVNADDIFVSRKGQVYINDETKSSINEIITGKVINYFGNIIGIYDDSIISIKDNNEITKKNENFN